MAILEKLSKEQQRVLIALPYRAGRWVSESDSSGGDEADQAEMAALESIVTSYAEDFCKSEFVEELMRQTVVHKEEWPAWSENLQDVPLECQRSVDVLSDYLEAKDVEAFKSNLMEIAVAVAMAYREMTGKPPLGLYIQYWLARLGAVFSRHPVPDLARMMNISRGER